jgi:hypothetical protein
VAGRSVLECGLELWLNIAATVLVDLTRSLLVSRGLKFMLPVGFIVGSIPTSPVSKETYLCVKAPTNEQHTILGPWPLARSVRDPTSAVSTLTGSRASWPGSVARKMPARRCGGNLFCRTGSVLTTRTTRTTRGGSSVLTRMARCGSCRHPCAASLAQTTCPDTTLTSPISSQARHECACPQRCHGGTKDYVTSPVSREHSVR